jgi:dienelactone hydrolase
MVPRTFCLFLLLAGLAEAGNRVEAEKLAETEGGILWRFGPHRVLVVSGTPGGMGRAHGRLLREEARAGVRAFLHEWAVERKGGTKAELLAIWDRHAPHVPPHFLEEMEGLAEGAGIPLDDLEALHAIPSRHHCTGAAAVPPATRDGRVYHTRSLDYALDIGATVRPQTNAILLVAVPEGGVPHAVVGWAGFLGCVTGMNLEGVGVGEMGSPSRDEGWDGLPMVFALRELLWRARTLEEARTLFRGMPQTCGFNFVFSDPRGACAVEVNRSLVRFFEPGDPREAVAPHSPLEGIVRRCNHFVDPELAATQREVYDPRRSEPSSWWGYESQGAMLASRRGAIDAATMIELLRGYPPTHPCLHQAVLCPSERAIWVSHARDPAQDPFAGAQNQPFLRYDLPALVRGAPAPAEVSGRIESGGGPAEAGVFEEPEKTGAFGYPAGKTAWRLRRLRDLGGVSVHELLYPSPGRSRIAEASTVFAEYCRPPGEGPFPAAVVLDILDGRGYVARLLCAALAQNGVAALYVKMPGYGERAPAKGIDPGAVELSDVVEVVGQGVMDVRRGGSWLRARPEVDAKKLGIVGVSLGSFLAQLAAGTDGDFARCAFVLGGARFSDALFSGAKDTRRAREFLAARGIAEPVAREALLPIEPLRFAARVRKEGVLMINCRSDEVVPPSSTLDYWSALGEPRIEWFDGGHYALKDRLFETLGLVVAHLKG